MWSPRRAFLGALVGTVLLVIGIVIESKSKTAEPSTLRVIYPVGLLSAEDRLLDPANLNSVYHYYLLENLASGLVSDSLESSSGCKGVLAESWRQDGERTWSFRIRPNLKWSDGSSLSGEQLRDFFTALATKNSRHLVAMRSLASVVWHAVLRELSFEFSKPTNNSILHELSLADSAVLHPANQSQGWAVTSGFYSVSKYDKGTGITLVANSNHPQFSADAPTTVRLYQPALKEWSFKEEQADLWAVPTPSFSAIARKRRSEAPEVKEGLPTAIYYFEFNPKHPLGISLSARAAFKSLVQEYFSKSVPHLEEARFENQLIAPGYPSRLEEFSTSPASREGINELRRRPLSLSLYYFAKELPWMSDQFAAFLEQAGVKADLSFERYRSPDPKDWFARASIFSGNQKDSIGTWSFLFSDKISPLGAFRDLVKSDLENATGTPAEAERETLLQRIHRTTLQQALVVPFLLEKRYAIHSNRINLSRWNPFDMRMRLYDVRRN